jgi:undecaprenyl-phosphate 4-deoxy-4-formamido-L-arabinose transferase
MLSVIIPVFNSESSIVTVVESIKETLVNQPGFEIILVNDSSTDNTYSQCRKLAEKYDFVKILDLSKNFGQHNAIIAGMNHACGDLVACMDDDMQTPPGELLKLVKKIEEGYDIVYANYYKKMHSIPRNLSSRIKNLLMTVFLNKSRKINITSYFIAKKFLIKEIIKYSGPFPFLGALVLRSTDNIGVVYIDHQKRTLGKSSYRWRSLLRMVMNEITNMTIAPLRISFLTGLACSVTGFVFAIIFFIRKLLNPDIVLGWTSTIIALLFFSGISLIMIGLVGEYVGRAFLHINKHPQFVIKEKINIHDKEKNHKETGRP